MGVVGLRDVFVVAPAASFHAQAQHHHQESLFSSQEHPIIPLLSAAPCLADDPHDSRAKSAGIHLWQQQLQNHHHHLHHQQQNPNPNPNPHNPYLKKPVPMLDATGIFTTTTTTSSGGGSTCQDCGNQAKKDCSHRRCRTCCKSRGFECSTHVKSTWVPAARRRERQLSTGAPGSSASTSAPKKPRLLSSQTTTTSHTSTSNNTRSFDTSSSHQDASFRENLPGQVKAPAVFKCVRVTSIDDEGEDEYAYQAMVNINGHVFKGFLYDQGTDDGGGEQGSITGVDNSRNNSSSNNNAILNISELHLGGGSSAGGGRNGPSSSPMVSPADMSGLLGGTNYGNPIN